MRAGPLAARGVLRELSSARRGAVWAAAWRWTSLLKSLLFLVAFQAAS